MYGTVLDWCCAASLRLTKGMLRVFSHRSVWRIGRRSGDTSRAVGLSALNATSSVGFFRYSFPQQLPSRPRGSRRRRELLWLSGSSREEFGKIQLMKFPALNPPGFFLFISLIINNNQQNAPLLGLLFRLTSTMTAMQSVFLDEGRPYPLPVPLADGCFKKLPVVIICDTQYF